MRAEQRGYSDQVVMGNPATTLLAASQNVYLRAFQGRGKTGGERPHKRLSKFDPLLASRVPWVRKA
jgi:hypothetical protein